MCPILESRGTDNCDDIFHSSVEAILIRPVSRAEDRAQHVDISRSSPLEVRNAADQCWIRDKRTGESCSFFKRSPDILMCYLEMS